MSVPVINPSTSLNVYRKGEYFDVLLSATNSPTSWGCIVKDAEGGTSALAAIGLSLNLATGLLQGAFKESGFYNLLFTAINADGSSSTLAVPVGIRDLGFGLDASIGLRVDVETGVVTRQLATNTTTTGGAVQPLLWGKHGCQMILDIGFYKGGVLLDDLVMGMVMVGLKELEPERLLDLSSGQFFVNDGVYRVLLDLDVGSLASVLGDYEDDQETLFNALAEVRYEHYEAVAAGRPRQLIRSRSRNFSFQIERDLIPN